MYVKTSVGKHMTQSRTGNFYRHYTGKGIRVQADTEQSITVGHINNVDIVFKQKQDTLWF